jgi:hypothetical protein
MLRQAPANGGLTADFKRGRPFKSAPSLRVGRVRPPYFACRTSAMRDDGLYGVAQLQFAASLRSPDPSYFAYCG